MSTVEMFREWCGPTKAPVPFKVRRIELMELAAVVGLALAVQAFSRGSASMFADIALQLALPFGAALTLRRSVGRPAIAVAAVLVTGLAAGIGLSLVFGRGDLMMTTNAYVAAGMVWVLTGSQQRSMKSTLLAATILAAAMTVAALI
jgi:hypothetical protein